MDNLTGRTVNGVTNDCITQSSLDVTASASTVTSPSQLTFTSSDTSLFSYCLIIISFIGIVANGFVTFLLIKSNRSSASTTKVLIASQCLIDSFYSLGSFLCYVVKLSGLNQYSYPPTKINSVICILLDSGTASAVFQNSSMWSYRHHCRTLLEGRVPDRTSQVLSSVDDSCHHRRDVAERICHVSVAECVHYQNLVRPMLFNGSLVQCRCQQGLVFLALCWCNGS
jgi:hypothetical protein